MATQLERNAVVAEAPQGSPVSPIIIVIYTTGLIKWVEQYVSAAEEQSLEDGLGWVASGSNVNHVILILERCAG
jgi:hypothetical protein